MATSNRDLVKPPEEPFDDPALRLDDASDRVAVLAGQIIDDVQDGGDPDPKALEDIRTAIGDVEEALSVIDPEGDQ